MNNDLAGAVTNHKVITFHYGGFPRIAEPHLYGLNKGEIEVLHAYQTKGGSESSEILGWRMFLVSKMAKIVVTEDTYKEVRAGYDPEDPRVPEVFAKA